MKQFKIIFLSFLVATFIGCDDEDESIFQTEPTSELTFTSTPASSYILTFETKDNTAERFTWNDLDFSTPIAVTYDLKAIGQGGDFANAELVGSTSETELSLNVEEMNDLALLLELTPFAQGVISLRVDASTADPAMGIISSEIINLSVTPYTTDSPKLWVPGNYADSSGYGANWTPSDPQTPFLEAVEFGSTEYEGFIFMSNASPEFKFTPTDQGFDGAFGDGGTGMLSNDGSAGNLTVPAAGYYYIVVNTDPNGDGDFSDATWSASERVWGIIGQATTPDNPAGWGDELDMTYDATAQLWTIDINLSADEFKFRSQAWNPDTNFGANSNGEPNQLGFDGGNLSVDSAGLYRVEMDLSVPRNYTFSLTSI